jgi:hypothetical protein
MLNPNDPARPSGSGNRPKVANCVDELFVVIALYLNP